MTRRKRYFGFRCAAALLVVWVGAATARAGGGPENVFLVVNSASWASQTVANHFIQLRHIPAINVFYIDWTGGFETIDGQAMREKILLPAIDAIERRNLLQQIDYIVYSSDFPYLVDLTNDFPTVRFSDQAHPACSINSATYLWNLAVAKTPILMDFYINHYMRAAASRKTDEPTHAFRSWYGWGKRGELLEAGGQPYMLSTVLALTSGRGNSVREAIAYLARSAAADGTHPKGTVYFTKTSDVRSRSRADEVSTAIEQLKELGVHAVAITTALPANRADVVGTMTGLADFSWAKSRSKILPGAICENFTSFGGIMAEDATQTPLSEFLRYGAAGSSGTVLEPYALAQKFPSPQVHVHYARGCTLAEAYYQAVFGPAQLLIVGDPLCRPWADIPSVQVAGVKPNEKVSSVLEITLRASVPGGGQIDHYELFVDGRRVDAAKAGEGLHWDSKTEGDGYHELRAVAIAAGPIETQGRQIVPLVVENHGRGVEISTTPLKTVRWDQTLTVHAKSAGASQILVVHNNLVLARIAGPEGRATINPRVFGTGPVSLQALAVPNSGARTYTSSAPVPLLIEPATPLPALKNPPAKLAPGLTLKGPSGKIVTVQSTRDPAWMALAGQAASKPFTLEGFFGIDADDLYQFQVWYRGSLKLSVDGTTLYSGQDGTYTQKFVPVALAAGKHRLTISGTTGLEVRSRILFGGPGAVSLTGTAFQHDAK